MVSPEDLELLTVTDDPREAVQRVVSSHNERAAVESPHSAEKADAQ